MKHCTSGAKSKSDCQILTWFYDSCAGLATSKDGAYGADWGRMGRIASRKAVAVCQKHGGKKCRVKKVVCAKR